jgi:hypothetical protein
MTRQIFRQAALDRLGASEALDHLVELVLPRPLAAAREAARDVAGQVAQTVRARLPSRLRGASATEQHAQQEVPHRRVRTPTI